MTGFNTDSTVNTSGYLEFRDADFDGDSTDESTEIRVDTSGGGNFSGNPVVVVLNVSPSSLDPDSNGGFNVDV